MDIRMECAKIQVRLYIEIFVQVCLNFFSTNVCFFFELIKNIERSFGIIYLL